MLFLLRQLGLYGSALTFGSVALLTLGWPRAVASAYGYTLGTVESYAQFRAVFFGFWLGLVVLLVTAARRKDVPLLGTLAGAMILLQAAGRGLSLALDGVPALPFVAAMLAELTTGLVIVLGAPRDGDQA